MIRHIDHLNLQVDDLAQTQEWYGRVFGFKIVEEGLQRGKPWCVLQSEAALLCLYQRGEQPRKPSEESRGDGMNHFAFKLWDADQWRHVLAREKIPVNYGGPIEWPHSTSWYVNDPSGYEIEVVHWHGGHAAFGEKDDHESVST